MKNSALQIHRTAIQILLVIVLSACAPTALRGNPLSVAVPTAANPDITSPTKSPASFPTPGLPTITPAATATVVLPTTLPTVELGLPSAKPPEVSAEVALSLENANQVVELAGWGAGYVFPVRPGQLASDGKILVQKEIIDNSPTFSGGTVRTRFWDIPSGDLSLELIHRAGYDGLDFSPDGTRFAIYQNYCHRENPKPCSLEIRSFPENGLLQISSDSGFINTAVFSPDNRTLALSTESDIAIWDVETGKPLRSLPNSLQFDLLAFSHDGKLLVGSQYLGDGTVNVWDVATGKLLHSLSSPKFSPEFSPNAIAFSPEDTYLVLTYGASVQLWKVSDWSEGPAWTWHETSEITQVTFSPDGRLIASGYADGTITIADTTSGKALKSWDNHNDDSYDYITGLNFTVDGKMLVSVSSDETVRIWGISS